MDQNAYRQRIVLQYFELRIALNKANGLRDDKTHLEFELKSDDDEEYVIIKSSGAHHGLRFAYRKKTTQNLWKKVENENFDDFFLYLLIGLRSVRETDSLNTQLTIWLFRLWMV